MKFFLGCLLSGIMGAVFTVWLNSPTSGQLVADGFVARQDGPIIPASATPAEQKPAPGLLPALNLPEPPASREPDYFDEQGVSAEERIAISVYEQANRSVVNISTRSSRPDVFMLVEYTSEGSGSGVVLDRSGHILTNFHVVENVSEVSVTLYDGKSYDATLVGGDRINDLAVLKIDAPEDVLHPVVFGDSGKLKVGMRVFAIGNPFELERTMTSGIISSLNRTLHIHSNRSIRSIIQIDAAVNPGNSGGPLLDSHGRVIGINMAIASKTGQSAGVGFAIPSNQVARVVMELIEHGRFLRPEIGIPRMHETEKGLLVLELTADGPAAKAGIRGPRIDRTRRGPFIITRVDRSAADLIISVDGQSVKTVDDLLSYIESQEAGDQIILTVQRDGQKVKVPLILARQE